MMNNKIIPKCVGIIMDGNRRWAKSKGLSTEEGHRAGADKLKEVISWIKKQEIENLVIYAFSTENWNRTEKEVSMLMKLFETFFINEMNELKKEKIRIFFVGQKEKFSKKFQEGMRNIEGETKDFIKGNLFIAVSYGGRAEIVSAIDKILSEKKKVGDITEENFSNYLWTKSMPDPDIVIRTGGDKRLSNFLLWQSAYSELFFVDTFWPDFSQEEFEEVLDEFSQRDRRVGK